MEKDRHNFTEGKTFLPLVKFTLPILLAIFLQVLYGAVDLLIVGQFGGEKADIYVSAVSTGSMIMQTLTIVITGLAMGLTILIGNKIGAGENEEAGKIIGSGICLFGIMSLIITILMSSMSQVLANLMQAPQEAFLETASYIRICSLGTFFIVAFNLIGSIFRGIGNSKIPFITVLIACIFNIIGDLILVSVFKMGSDGTAIATVLAQAVSVILSIFIIKKVRLPFNFSYRYIKIDRTYFNDVLRLGSPIAFQDLLVAISFLFITGIVNNLGLIISAGVGVAEKVCGFLMLIPSAYMQSLSAIVAQNIGASKPERAKRFLYDGISSAVCVGVIIAYITFFHGNYLISIFAEDERIILAGTEYLKAYAFDCVLLAFLFCMIGYFNGCGATRFVMIQGIVGAFLVRVPVSWIMSQEEPLSLFHIGLATPSSSVVQIVLCVIVLKMLERQFSSRN